MAPIASFLKKKIGKINLHLPRPLGQGKGGTSRLASVSSPHFAGGLPLDSQRLLDERAGSGKATRQFVEDSLHLELQLLRRSLGLTTVAVLVVSVEEELLYLRGIASDNGPTLNGPFPLGLGVTGALLKGREEIALAGINKPYAGLPYYREPVRIGGVIAMNLMSQGAEILGYPSPRAILCADRISVTAWGDDEREFLRLAGRKIALELALGWQLSSLDQEREAIQQLCAGLRELNKGLGLESVFQATVMAVKALVPVDFIAVSLADQESHHTAFVAGDKCPDHLLGMEYGVHEGLIGQVIRLNHPLPANARYSGPAPVFSRTQTLSGYRSLFILPLAKEEGGAMGALTVAAKGEGVFGKVEQDVLGLIAAQVGIKIDLAKSHELLSKLATTDGLTDLANHRTFQHGFDIMLHRAKRRNSPLTLILCDIDWFKKINDSYGHQFGDQVLKGVAKVLSDAVRREDLAARYGGEEFALILENSDKTGATQMAERIRQDIAALMFMVEAKKIGVTISLGISAFPEDGQKKTTIIEKADQALYSAKRQGRNRTVIWDAWQGEEGEKR